MGRIPWNKPLQIRLKMKEILDYFISETLRNRVCEICGFLGKKDGQFVAKIVKNKHSDPKNYFAIDPLDFLHFKRENEIVAIFHDHLSGDSSASDFDKVNSENTATPFLIYSVPEKRFSLFVPENSEVSKEVIEEVQKFL